MRLQRTIRNILLAGAAMFAALMSPAAGAAQSLDRETSQAAALRPASVIDPNHRFTDLMVLMPLEVTPVEFGSLITISGDRPFRGYWSRYIGDWFELRVFAANAGQIQDNFAGDGLQNGRVFQSGVDAVFLFSLMRGVHASVTTSGNRLIVEISRAIKSVATAKPAAVATVPPILRNHVDLPPSTSLPLAVPVPTVDTLAEIVALKTVVVSEEPPLPIIKRNPPPRMTMPLTLSTAIPSPVADISIGLITTSVRVEVDTPPPPPPISNQKSIPDGSQTSQSSVAEARTETTTPADKAATSDGESTTVMAMVDPVATGSDTAPVVDPNKPAPANINLPTPQLRRSNARAPLSNERRFELTGVISFDYSKTSQASTSENLNAPPAKSWGHNFGVGLDLHLGTFLIDPRFLKLSFDTGFATNRGGFDEFTTRQGNKGAGVYVDFLPTSPYPLRFHYTRQNTHFLEQQISSASTGRSSLGFDWALRKPKLPNLSVNFDDTSYMSRFLASSSFKSQARTLSISLTDNVKGWDVNSNFNRQSATEGITNLKTNLNFMRFDAHRQLSKKANLFVNSFFEKLRFDNPRTRLGQDFSFFDVHTDINVQQTKKLSFRTSHQFYYSSDDQAATPTDGETGRDTVASVPSPKSITSFHSVQGQVNYRIWPSLSFTGAANSRFIQTPTSGAENVSRFLDFTAGFAWNKRIGFAETRAGFIEGVTQVATNLSAQHTVHFRTYSAGISMGRISRALITADFNATSRPDAFQLGGFYSQKNVSTAIETRAIGRFQIRASLGANTIDYLTASGREHLRTTTYSVSVDDKWFTVLLNHNSNSGVRDIFLVPITIGGTRVFRILPVDSLIRDPLLNAGGAFTLALARFKPRRGLDLEVRYLKDRAIFARTNDVFTEQFDVLARYKIGQVTLTSGLIFFTQDTEGLFRRDRNYFFVRVSRPFTLF